LTKKTLLFYNSFKLKKKIIKNLNNKKFQEKNDEIKNLQKFIKRSIGKKFWIVKLSKYPQINEFFKQVSLRRWSYLAS